MIVPPALVGGSTLRVIAPSSPFDAAAVTQGIAYLQERYQVRFDPAIFEREGFLAGNDERRLHELQSALEEPEVMGIVAARGGYGLNRIAHRLEFSALTAQPRWLIGFSDITVLHIEAARVGVASLHAHNVAGLGSGDTAAGVAWQRVLEAPLTPYTFDQLEVWQPGQVRGPLFGGNLTVLHACAAAGRLRIPKGAVLAIEDVGEPSYRIDRALTTLRTGGYLESISGVLVGEFTDCSPGRHGVTIEAVLRERLTALGVPVLAGAPFGHGARNEPLVLGADARLDGETHTATLGLVPA